MDNQNNLATSTSVVSLDTTLNIQRVGPLTEHLKQVLEKNQKVVLDGTHVKTLDTAGLQLLAAFIQHADKTDVQVEWKNPSPTLYEAASLFGLSRHLQLDAIADSLALEPQGQ